MIGEALEILDAKHCWNEVVDSLLETQTTQGMTLDSVLVDYRQYCCEDICAYIAIFVTKVRHKKELGADLYEACVEIIEKEVELETDPVIRFAYSVLRDFVDDYYLQFDNQF